MKHESSVVAEATYMGYELWCMGHTLGYGVSNMQWPSMHSQPAIAAVAANPSEAAATTTAAAAAEGPVAVAATAAAAAAANRPSRHEEQGTP